MHLEVRFVELLLRVHAAGRMYAEAGSSAFAKCVALIVRTLCNTHVFCRLITDLCKSCWPESSWEAQAEVSMPNKYSTS